MNTGSKRYRGTLGDKEWLIAHYVTEGKSIYEIGELAGCPGSTVARALHRHGVPTRQDRGEVGARNICPACSKEFAVGGRGRPPRGQVYCSRHCAMLQQGPRRTGSHAPRPRKNLSTIHTDGWLYQKYVVEQLSTTDIGKMLGVPRVTVKWHLRKQGIKSRSQREARKVLFDRQGRRDVTQQEMIDAYGGTCACCGETAAAFLTLDHIGGGGKEHRERCGGPRAVRQDLKARGWPRDKYRLLCMNCNHAVRHGRTCPHELARQAALSLPDLTAVATSG